MTEKILPLQTAEWSTDAVSVHERFDYWYESVKSSFNPMSPTLAPEKVGSFRGRIHAQYFGQAVRLAIEASGHDTGRSERDISNGRRDCVALYQELAQSRFEFDWAGKSFQKELYSKPYDVILGDPNRPYRRICPVHGEIRQNILFLPRGMLRNVLLNPDEIKTRVISSDRGMGILLAKYFDAFLKYAPYTRQAQEVALQTLVVLVASAYGELASDCDPREALRTAQLEAAQQIIRRLLTADRLSPRLVADEMGVSVRTLHRLFELSGTTVARYITAQRLELAKQMLRSPDRQHHNVLTIAFDCGFESLPTFYRAFRQAYMCSPQEYQRGA